MKRVLGCALAVAMTFPLTAYAKRFDLLYTFRGTSDGDLPKGTLLVDASGNLYGTTSYGGGTEGAGTIFKLAPDGTKTIIYFFCSQTSCKDGSHPYAGLISDGAGILYGTTAYGGSAASGVVFKLAPDGTETVLYSFCSQTGCTDGAYPYAPLVADENGNLYGTTYGGGTSFGVVFKVAPDGTETVLHTFTGGADGASPQTGLLRDKKGNLYGTTPYGGTYAGGLVFKLAPDGAEKILYLFCAQTGCTDGGQPEAGLVRDRDGNFYGTTYYGGASDNGVVFELARDGTETVLYSFCAQSNCTDGSGPITNLVPDGRGNLFGTASLEGARGSGVAFKLAPDHTETVLHSFSDLGDGGGPNGLTPYPGGYLVGTAEAGGKENAGTIFEISK